ncbi:MAG: autotransporter outer membrane beta-barrel domain-containing protein [Sutterella wadsworthensis]|nr:autotransporter outer membrane beta-barrel domain-containing protein [Sutterella wadsworthensis]
MRLRLISSPLRQPNNLNYVVKHEAYATASVDNLRYNKSSEDTPKPNNEVLSTHFGNGGTNWYIGVEEKKPDDGGDDNGGGDNGGGDNGGGDNGGGDNGGGDNGGGDMPYTPSSSGEAIISMARGTYWQSIDLDRLNKCMGDRRMAEGDNGLWVRLRHDRIGTNTGMADFRAKDTTYQMGYEHTWTTATGKRMAGIAIDYRDGDIDYRALSGDGTNNRVGLTGYYTWLGDNGWYTDLVARFGRLENDFKIQNSLGETVKGNYHNNLFGLSFEGGKKIALGESAWFVEPQGQIQFMSVGSADYTTTQGTRVKMDNISSFVSHASFRLGRDFGAKSTQAYVKADWLHEWAGKQGIRAYDKTTPKDGTDASLNNRSSWYDVGFGAQTLFGKSVYGYIDAEYQFGSALESSWALNTGLRWQF